MEMLAAADALRRVSLELGFSACGVADAAAAQGDTLRDWLASGAHAGMGWMESHLEARLNPELLLPGVKRVVMLSYEYSREDARREQGRIARYAQGQDYHRLLAPKLADLDELLQVFGGVQRGFADSGPVSERFFAQQAGLGWLGRHGLLVRPKLGSYCVLACLLTTLELPLDAPMPNRCGSCHSCEQSCPTAALADGLCDARRCLSYWTIEAKEAMPADVQAVAGDRLFGCDICQEACPWNGAVAPTLDARMLMPDTLASMPLAEFSSMSEADFERYFAGSALRRAGLDRLRERARQIEE